MGWHAQDKGRLNGGVARNALLFANGEALIEVGRLDERRDFAAALSIVDLQMVNMRALRSLDPEAVDKELRRFGDVRRILAGKLEGAHVPVPAPPVGPEDDAKLHVRDYVLKGLELSSKVLPGLWGTVARLLVVLIE
jgi:hypothetical protein